MDRPTPQPQVQDGAKSKQRTSAKRAVPSSLKDGFLWSPERAGNAMECFYTRHSS